ncbi:DUF5052 domain-containing protein [Paenibacillus sp. MMO-58]|uniref:DUF5052 domain-containing protein n=1 Tax=Paenibacillus sp. MMO-58 TaxID=3081290 RepID=UPI003015CA58
MKKKLAVIAGMAVLMLLMSGCGESYERYQKDLQSEYHGGLQRSLKVYSATGEQIAEYEGKFDIEADTSGSGKIKFDLDGKRVIIYNATVITEEQ